MASLFSTPKAVAPVYNITAPSPAAAAGAPQTVVPTQAPTVTDRSVQAAGDAQTNQTASAAGRGSTILTSGLGDTSAATIGKKTLLGQ